MDEVLDEVLLVDELEYDTTEWLSQLRLKLELERGE